MSQVDATVVAVCSDQSDGPGVDAALGKDWSVRNVRKLDFECDNEACVVVNVENVDAAADAAIRQMRQANPEVPIVVVVPIHWTGDVDAVLDAGADDVVRTDLTDGTSRLLERRVAVAIDVSEQRSDRELRFFQEAMGQVGAGIAAYTRDGTIQYANDSYATLLGTTRSDLIGRNVCEVNPEFDPDRFDEYWDSYHDGETRTHETIHQRMDDGMQFQVSTVTTRARIHGTDYHIGTIRDITERKLRERELKTFRKAIEHAGHGVLITDVDGVIEYVNPAFEAKTGYSRGEVLGQTPAILNSGHHDEAFYADLWDTILDGEVWKDEVINERKDGSEYVVEQTIAPIIDDDGNVERFVAINSDITELKEHKQALERQNDRLEEYGRTIAHDLRNPLTVVEGRAEYMLANDTGDADQLETICEQVDRMKQLIDELLEMAKQGRTVHEPSIVSLQTTARDAWESVESQAASLVVQEEVTVRADKQRLEELLWNLFRNSVTHGGADVTVEVGTLDDRDGFYVQDDGCGVDPEICDRVFEVGFTSDPDGTGFGLAIVDRIASAHDWAVEVTDAEFTDTRDSAAQSGARFEFEL